MHPCLGQTIRDRVISANCNLKRCTLAVAPGGSRRRIRNELAVFVIPERAVFLAPAAPSAHAVHFIEREPVWEGVIGGVYTDEAASTANVFLKRCLQFRRPSLIRRV